MPQPTTRAARAARRGKAAGQQAGQHVKRGFFRPGIGAHTHDDGEVCQGYHADTRCVECDTRWALCSWRLCAPCLSAKLPTHRPDGTHVPIDEGNAALALVKRQFAAPHEATCAPAV